jgi:hypothetical protein
MGPIVAALGMEWLGYPFILGWAERRQIRHPACPLWGPEADIAHKAFSN